MGNCGGKQSSDSSVKVIRLEEGKIDEYKEAIKVEDLMMENPFQILCKLSELRKGKTVKAMPCEQELEVGRMYVMLPLHKLCSPLSSSDMSSILSVSQEFSSPSVNTKVFPDLTKNEDKPVNDDKKEEDDVVVDLGSLFVRGSRPWRPSLETIVETDLNQLD